MITSFRILEQFIVKRLMRHSAFLVKKPVAQVEPTLNTSSGIFEHFFILQFSILPSIDPT
jgi:hypothetical protein